MEAVGGSVLSTTLQVLFDRIALNQEFLRGIFPGNKKLQLNRLIRVLRIVSPVLEDAENKQERSPAVKAWFNSIRHAVYQADDVLDEINTERLRINLQHSKGNLSDTDTDTELSPTLEEIRDTNFSDLSDTDTDAELSPTVEEIRDTNFSDLSDTDTDTELSPTVEEISNTDFSDLTDNDTGTKLSLTLEEICDTDFSDQFIGELSPTLEDICDALERKVQRIGMFGLRILYGNQKREDKRLSTSVVNKTEIFGRDDEKEKIIQMVLSGEGGTDISVIPITGMGGIGKTTLAQLVYNDERVKNLFKTRAWICISEEFDVYRATKDLLKEVNLPAVDDKDDLSRLQLKLKDNLGGKRFIIILDDIWNDNYNDCQHLMSPLNSGCRGSKIIVTTRNENIAVMLQNKPFHRLKPITDDQSWSLFKLHAAFDNRARSLSPEFETVGRRILKKCKGLPLAIKTIGSALSSKNAIHEWREILSSENWMVVGDILPALSLSYKLLPAHLKCCFALCAVFFKDVPFDKNEVALLWMANDLVQPSNQKVAHKYFEELRSRSFFDMVHVDKYVMHDLVNDLARIVSGNFCARQEDYQLENLHLGIQGKNNLPPPEVLHFSYMASDNDVLKRFRGLAQGLRTFLPISQSGTQLPCITPLFFSHILPKFRHVRALSLHKYHFASMIPYSIGHLKHLRFLNLAGIDIRKLPNDIPKCLNLQTLILTGCYNLKKLPEDMGLLINLQHLDVGGCQDLEKLPEDMGLLINLQHLDVSNCKKLKKLIKHMGALINLQHLDIGGCQNLEKLPEDMRLLISLQHLNVSGCSLLEKLPEDIGLLINLQHLDISGCSRLKELPKYMGLLINLQYFKISGCWELEKLPEDMRNLINLQLYEVVERINGDTLKHLDKLKLGQLLEISLDNAVTVEMAKKVELKNKNCIEKLTLEWRVGKKRSKDELNIFAELIPHTNIRQLHICGYRGTTFSSWLGVSSFCNIESLTLKDCYNCIHLPPLGQLTGLKVLEISGMDGIREVGEEFYGNSSICKPFQVLEDLKIEKMPEWTTWNMHPDNADFLSLKKFEITECPKLVGDIPFHLTLRTLEMKIKNCPSISLYLQSCDLKELYMEWCKYVEFLGDDICNSSLESLTIVRCGISTETIPLFSFSKLQYLFIRYLESPLGMFKIPNGYHPSLTSLQSLYINSCNSILSFPEGGLPAPNLKTLKIWGCIKLKSLPEEMHTQLSSLRKLDINDCPEMECFPDGGLPHSLEDLDILDCKKLMMFPRNWGLQRLPSLTTLSINGIEDKLFPEEGLLPASLKDLYISNCPNLEALNHKGFQYIKELLIYDFPELRYLPEEGLPSSLSKLTICDCPELRYLPELSSLSELRIDDCPKVAARIEREKGEDWPKIQSIPIILLDDELIS